MSAVTPEIRSPITVAPVALYGKGTERAFLPGQTDELRTEIWPKYGVKFAYARFLHSSDIKGDLVLPFAVAASIDRVLLSDMPARVVAGFDWHELPSPARPGSVITVKVTNIVDRAADFIGCMLFTTAEGIEELANRAARPHIVNGEFQSDKYPTTPPGKVPLSVEDANAQDLLWAYAQRRRGVDAQFSDDLEFALRSKGYAPPETPKAGGVITKAYALGLCWSQSMARSRELGIPLPGNCDAIALSYAQGLTRGLGEAMRPLVGHYPNGWAEKAWRMLGAVHDDAVDSVDLETIRLGDVKIDVSWPSAHIDERIPPGAGAGDRVKELADRLSWTSALMDTRLVDQQREQSPCHSLRLRIDKDTQALSIVGCSCGAPLRSDDEAAAHFAIEGVRQTTLSGVSVAAASEKWAECDCGWTGRMSELADRDGIKHCPNCNSTVIREDITL